MKIADFERLKLLMNMTQSSNDQEALTAIRKANALLAENRVDWAKVFARLVTLDVEGEPDSQDVPSHRDHTRVDISNRTFQRALENAKGEFRDVVMSIYDQWQRKGSITERQADVVRRAAE